MGWCFVMYSGVTSFHMILWTILNDLLILFWQFFIIHHFLIFPFHALIFLHSSLKMTIISCMHSVVTLICKWIFSVIRDNYVTFYSWNNCQQWKVTEVDDVIRSLSVMKSLDRFCSNLNVCFNTFCHIYSSHLIWLIDFVKLKYPMTCQ